MCVRTKNSYGCGHNYKETVDCRSSRCSGLERHHVKNEWDCLSCRAGGTSITRGVEGKGRYAQENKLQSREREPLADVSGNDRSESQTSPWATSKPKNIIEEKLWHTPTRQKADDAWLAEHAERQQSVSPRNSPSRDLMFDLENHSPQRRRDDTDVRLHREVKKIQDTELRSARRRQVRQDSFDSIQSIEIEDRRPRSRGHSYGHRSHGDSHSNSHNSRIGRHVHGSYDSGFVVAQSPASHGHTHIYGYTNSPSHGYNLGYDMGHGVRNMMRDAGARWKSF